MIKILGSFKKHKRRDSLLLLVEGPGVGVDGGGEGDGGAGSPDYHLKMIMIMMMIMMMMMTRCCSTGVRTTGSRTRRTWRAWPRRCPASWPRSPSPSPASTTWTSCGPRTRAVNETSRKFSKYSEKAPTRAFSL